MAAWTCALVATGCVARSLTIKSEPPGALVYMNDKLKGTTPFTYDFEWYGGYRVMLRKEGYERIEERRVLRAPVPLWIPFDLVMEMVPWTIRDDREWSFTLMPLSPLGEPTPPDVGPSRAQRRAAEEAARAAQAAGETGAPGQPAAAEERDVDGP